MSWGSLPAHAVEISALLVGPLLLLVSVMLTTGGGSLYAARAARPNRLAAGIGSMGMAIFLAGGIVVGLSAAMHPDREAHRGPGAPIAEPATPVIALAPIPPAAVPADPSPATADGVVVAEQPAVPPETAVPVLTPGGALFRRPVVLATALGALPARDLRPDGFARRAGKHRK